MSESRYATSPVNTTRMPPGIPYIVGNEAAERFSYYGMRTILTAFMIHYLWLMGDRAGTPMSEPEATKRFHDFAFLTYLLPVFGALLADAFWGKYRVIIVLSIVYCLGHLALALMGIAGEATLWLSIGLWLIAAGSGGIKPCVSAHVGDQFGAANQHLLPKAFNWFYWSINLGAFFSTLLTPWLLEWYGPHWAFGVPGVLMAMATAVFWLGRYRFAHIPARGTPFLKEVFSREGFKALGKLSVILVFVAMFWSLFDQQGSSWVLQAESMDRRWLGIEWLPSQLQVFNPILILTLIPLFSYVVYPAIHRFFPLTPLRKIGIGLFLMVVAFALVALAQEKIDAGERPSISWQLVAYVFMTASEVMVSIVFLEFCYTQAPVRMKSVMMTIYLFAVAVGNKFTAEVNRFIQVPSPVAGIQANSMEVRLEGYDKIANTLDDILLRFDAGGSVVATEFAGQEVLGGLIEALRVEVSGNGYQALSPEAGKDLVSNTLDPWGQPYQYERIHRHLMRIVSLGPDQQAKTQWDMGATITIEAPEASEPSRWTAWIDHWRPEESWIDRRRQALGLSPRAAAGSEPVVTHQYFVGGQNRLEGASYFWFFTGIMLAAALVFVVVAKGYRPVDYLHSDEGGESGVVKPS